jgi:SAM-dependent methyltransferase
MGQRILERSRKSSANNPFQDFFEDHRYVILKNYLYNYILRRRAVEKVLVEEPQKLMLEVGSGLSPVMTPHCRIVYSDLSLTALQAVKHFQEKGWYVVADALKLPFKSGVFTQAISSEVLEHLADDRAALRELARVMAPSGHLVVTFPHRRFYFANDDRFVGHFRRYELSEMGDRLKEAGLRPVLIHKVLGPLEKATMCFAVFSFSMIQRFYPKREGKDPSSKAMSIFVAFFKWTNCLYAGLVWLDAKIMPRTLSAVLLIKAEKE